MSNDPIAGARTAAEMSCNDLAPIVIHAYLAAMVRSYDELAGGLAAAEDLIARALSALTMDARSSIRVVAAQEILNGDADRDANFANFDCWPGFDR